jgi:hypothetical protein
MLARRVFFIALAAAMVSCVERGPAGPDLPGGIVAAQYGNSAHGLLPCTPLAYDSVTATVGPPGGVLRVSEHALWIPGGALTSWVSITMVAPSGSVNRVQFQPEGLHFNRPVALTMSYANCTVDWSTVQGIAYTNDSLAVLESEPSVDDAAAKKVTGALSHFSSYAVSW